MSTPMEKRQSRTVTVGDGGTRRAVQGMSADYSTIERAMVIPHQSIRQCC